MGAGLLLEAEGAIEEAYAALAGCWDLCADAGLAVDYPVPVLGPDLVRLALAVGEEGRARQVAAAVAEVAAGNQAPSLAGSALLGISSRAQLAAEAASRRPPGTRAD